MNSTVHLLTDQQAQQLIQEERNRRRVARLIQVRHQAKEHAKKVLDKVKVEKEVKLKSIQNNLKSQLEVRRDERIRRLNQQLSWSLNACGEAELKAEARVNETEEKIAKTQESIRAIRLKHRAALQAELTAKRNLQVKPLPKKKESSLVKNNLKKPQKISIPLVKKYPFDGQQVIPNLTWVSASQMRQSAGMESNGESSVSSRIPPRQTLVFDS